MEQENLLKIIRAVSKENLTEFQYEDSDIKIKICADSIKQESPLENTREQIEVYDRTLVELKKEKLQETKVCIEDRLEGKKVIKSPLVGVFYAAPGEECGPFVAVGDKIEKGQILAIVEAMKLMNDIESDFDGVIKEVLVENGKMVEYGQPLFLVE